MATDLSRATTRAARLRTAFIIVVAALLATQARAGPASASAPDDDSEQRVQAAPPNLPELRAWVVDDGGLTAVSTSGPPADAAEQVRHDTDLRLAEDEANRRAREIAEGQAEAIARQARLGAAMAEANERVRREWEANVARMKAKCRRRPRAPCPFPPPPPHAEAGSNGVMISYAVAPFQAELRWARQIPLSRFPGSDDPAKAPWQLRHKCGAGLLSDQWVMTAAHCAAPGDLANGLEVYVGTDDISSDAGVAFDVVEVVPHPGYSPTNMYSNDIALLRIRPKAGEKLPDNVRSLILPGGPPSASDPVFVPGWGRILDTDRRPVATLRRYAMTIVPQAQCQALPGYGPRKIHDGVLCAGGGGVKTCEGDSGGPLVIEGPRDALGVRSHRVVGVVSWNKSTCDGKLDPRPGVYTNVARYVPWIRSVIGTPSNAMAR